MATTQTKSTPATAADDAAPQHDQAPALEQQMAAFLELMERRTAAAEAAAEQRLAAFEQRVERRMAELAAERAGLIPPPDPQAPSYVTHEQALDAGASAAAAASERQVAFIPKDDPLNPASKTFDTWINGKLIRIRRGEIGMMTLGHGVGLARGGHGHVIDLAAMQQVAVAQNPDYSTRDDDFPTERTYERMGSSVPREVYAGAV